MQARVKAPTSPTGIHDSRSTGLAQQPSIHALIHRPCISIASWDTTMSAHSENETDMNGNRLVTTVAFTLLAPLALPLTSSAQSTLFGNGTTTNKAVYEKNLAFGYQALHSNTTGYSNTAIGLEALFSNTTGYLNTATGEYALFSNTTGSQNTADGYYALFYNTTGNNNTATGFEALVLNTAGYENTADGYQALYSNTTGDYNTANGYFALYSNTTGGSNTVNGCQALQFNTTGSDNTAEGVDALQYNSTGYYNTANGAQALVLNTTGYQNTANGGGALFYNTTGNNNTAEGEDALLDNGTGSNNIALGYGAGANLTSGNNNIDIGNTGIAAESSTIRIGSEGTQTATYIAGIDGATSLNGVTVFINANGQLGTRRSSRRFKKDIHTMNSASDKLMQLRPVTFRYKQAAEDGSYPLQYGLIAEEVAKVYPDLVQYDKEGMPLAIYDYQLTPMLLNELQKQHRQIVGQKSEIAAQNVRIASLTVALKKQIAELASLKQTQQQQLKVLAKLAASVQSSQHTQDTLPAAYMQH